MGVIVAGLAWVSVTPLTASDVTILPHIKAPTSPNVDEVVHVKGTNLLKVNGRYLDTGTKYVTGKNLEPQTSINLHRERHFEILNRFLRIQVKAAQQSPEDKPVKAIQLKSDIKAEARNVNADFEKFRKSLPESQD